MELPAATIEALAAHYDAARRDAHAPALAWGVVAGGGVVAGSGVRTSFRIASMTKSFTAAAVLLLRDEGRVRLDDPIGAYVGELEGLRGPTADSPPVTVRHLLTMSSGMPEDDPWGDRLLDIDADALAALFRRGASFARPPGVAYEYCNYGYAMLGRLVANVSGVQAQRFISERLLAPLGMTRTTWTAPGDCDAASGYRWDGALEPEVALGDGGFALMGGLWSTVDDLAKWVGFFCDAFPPRNDPDPGPLSRASRREMQQPHRPFPPEATLEGDRLDLLTGGYGMGLVAYDDTALGRTVGHSGGLPGFGSNMRWWPDSGVGVIALANVTYARMEAANERAARLLRPHLPPPAPVRALALEAAGRRLGAVVAAWSDEAAGTLFETNVALDRAFALRAADAARLRDRHGALAVDRVEAASPTAGTAWLRGERGAVRVRFDVSSAVPPRIQRYECTSVLDPPAEYAAAARAILAGDAAPVVALRALAGALALGEPWAYDGGARATFRVVGERGVGTIAVVLAAGEATGFDLAVEPFG